MIFLSPALAPKRRGFTLIELLVVIAIIAILAAILFPVFAQARAKARQTACLSNEKQMGNALMMYAQDYDETLPFGGYYPWGANKQSDVTNPIWMDMIFPYVKNTQVFTCPSFEGDGSKHEQYVYQAPDFSKARATQFGTYALNNAYAAMKAVSAHGPGGAALADIKVPADTIFVVETGDWGMNRNGTTSWTNNPTVNTTVNPPSLFANQGGVNANVLKLYHNGGANTLFCDGHAKWYRGENLIATHNVGASATPICYLWTMEED